MTVTGVLKSANRQEWTRKDLTKEEALTKGEREKITNPNLRTKMSWDQGEVVTTVCPTALPCSSFKLLSKSGEDL